MKSVQYTFKKNWLKGKAFLLSLIGQNEKALSFLEELVAQRTIDTHDWWYIGYLYLRLQEWDKASKAFLKAIAKSGGQPNYIFWLGKVQQQKGNNLFAESIYTKAIQKNENFYEALTCKGQIALEQEEYQKSLCYFEDCLKFKPKDAIVLNAIGLCYLGMNKSEEAYHYFEKALSIRPKDATIRYNFATSCMKIGNFQKAILELKKITHPDDPCQLYETLGYCYSMMGDYSQSIASYQEAHTYNPQNREILLNLAVTYAKLGDNKQALAILRLLVTENPLDPELLNNVAWVYDSLSQFKEAEQQYYRGLAMSPGNPQIAYNLICCLKKQKNYLESLDIVSHLNQDPAWHDLAWSAKAQAYEGLGANSLATDCYNKALGLK